tara:strand:+ start:1011 stop:1121 length:111 start_codon:yes stop_codon:yes gene_type:complete
MYFVGVYHLRRVVTLGEMVVQTKADALPISLLGLTA